MTLKIQVMAWERHRNAAVLNPLMGSQASPLDNLISNGNINKRKQKMYRFVSLKMTTYYQKQNDNINMDSTIGGSMNDRS
jgi:hypothetical protein